MGSDIRNGRSLIKVDSGRIGSLLSTLKFPVDSELSLYENLIECLEERDWQFVEQSSTVFSFSYDSEILMDWEQFLPIAQFLVDGSFFEERPGDYVQDLQGNSCSGVMRASVECGVLRCRVYAIIRAADGLRTRQLIEEVDPELF